MFSGQNIGNYTQTAKWQYKCAKFQINYNVEKQTGTLTRNKNVFSKSNHVSRGRYFKIFYRQQFIISKYCFFFSLPL